MDGMYPLPVPILILIISGLVPTTGDRQTIIRVGNQFPLLAN